MESFSRLLIDNTWRGMNELTFGLNEHFVPHGNDLYD